MASRILARGDGWRVQDVICTAGPQDRAFEERHAMVSIAMVTAGTFQYRSSLGAAVLTPGALMLGGPGVCFECGHEHGVGDRCIAFQYHPETWERIVAAVPGAKRGRVTRPQLPPMESMAPLLAEAEAARDDADADWVSGMFEDLAQRVAGTVAGALADSSVPAKAPAARDIRRVTEIVRGIEAQPEEPARLDTLASDAAMSPYHFLRTFRAVVGMAPHQYLLRTRLHRAALRLRQSKEEVAAIAFEAGFNDLSTFNRRFKRVMGVAPSSYRSGADRVGSRR